MSNIRDIADVIRLHDAIIDKSGGSPGVREEKLLAAALERPFSGLADGTEFFPSIESKAAILLHSLIQFHPFIDGNKRTGIAITQIYLLEHNYRWEFEQDEIVEFVIKIATKKLDLEEITHWIKKRIKARG